MPSSADVLSWSTLTPAINEMKSPNDFVKNTIFRVDRPVDTRNIELSFLRRGRKIAPFVKRNGAAIMTGGRDESFAIVSPPHIRIKRPMTPSELLTKRRPGSVIFPGADGIGAAMREYMANEMEMMLDDVTNSEEYLACLALRGAISYTSVDEAAFSVTFPRSASHDITLAGVNLWTDPASKPSKNVLQASQLISDDVSLAATDVILGSEAADAFLANAEVEKKLTFQPAYYRQGVLDLTNPIASSGALLLGEFVHGIRVWRYTRQVEVDGVATDLIRPKYAEFVANVPAAQFVTYYGAIEDMKAIGAGRVLQSKRFSKSWEEEDPSARMLLVESNPLPCMRRPDATVSMKVVA